MATREQKLIGYQLLKHTYHSNQLLVNASKVLQKLDPGSNTVLMEPVSIKDAEIVKVQEAGVAYIKEAATLRFNMASGSKEHVTQFISRYPVWADIDNGLSVWGETRLNVVDNATDVTMHVSNGLAAVALQVSEEQLNSTGILLALYSPKVALARPTETVISQTEKSTNSFQNIINAIGYNLQGKCCYQGTPKYTTVEAIKKVVLSRITAANKCWERVPATLETESMKSELEYVNTELPNATTLEDLKALGDSLLTAVPVLPLVTAWWRL